MDCLKGLRVTIVGRIYKRSEPKKFFILGHIPNLTPRKFFTLAAMLSYYSFCPHLRSQRTKIVPKVFQEGECCLQGVINLACGLQFQMLPRLNGHFMNVLVWFCT